MHLKKNTSIKKLFMNFINSSQNFKNGHDSFFSPIKENVCEFVIFAGCLQNKKRKRKTKIEIKNKNKK